MRSWLRPIKPAGLRGRRKMGSVTSFRLSACQAWSYIPARRTCTQQHDCWQGQVACGRRRADTLEPDGELSSASARAVPHGSAPADSAFARKPALRPFAQYVMTVAPTERADQRVSAGDVSRGAEAETPVAALVPPPRCPLDSRRSDHFDPSLSNPLGPAPENRGARSDLRRQESLDVPHLAPLAKAPGTSMIFRGSPSTPRERRQQPSGASYRRELMGISCDAQMEAEAQQDWPSGSLAL